MDCKLPRKNGLSTQMKALDLAIWEMSEAFSDLPDEDVWKRADPRLLSIGELAAHVSYWEGIIFLGEDFQSPLNLRSARYYDATLEEPLVLDLTATQLYAEVKRVHELCKQAFENLQPQPEQKNPYRQDWTWGSIIEYQGFHIAYHVGQMYSVRHLLGHQTPDN